MQAVAREVLCCHSRFGSARPVVSAGRLNVSTLRQGKMQEVCHFCVWRHDGESGEAARRWIGVARLPDSTCVPLQCKALKAMMRSLATVESTHSRR